MKDQSDFLASRGVNAKRIDYTTSAEDLYSINKQVLSGELKILYVSPERYVAVYILHSVHILHLEM